MARYSCIQIGIAIGIESVALSAATQTVALDCPVRSVFSALKVPGRAMTA
ncbi:hypothetical protein [Desulfohalobium retbaense]|uniref:Uncharacterized protein n=1 Tax=Desulfohalobium retbaense (strain ATCC 49708 / DSM 5692 / JCM 16813 / HR100) TaxID=485915 RepID=C8WZ67_DESRD|nr:hypothetical protein [Desulfohalobium retbaense]ACV67342.1 hypothetical protein Dret_0040 [Desulfohalobium retbaense DSM 5692]